MGRTMSHAALSEPPEGVLAGENVPRENEEDDQRRQEIEAIKGTLKARSPIFREMSESKLEERALEVYREVNE